MNAAVFFRAISEAHYRAGAKESRSEGRGAGKRSKIKETCEKGRERERRTSPKNLVACPCVAEGEKKGMSLFASLLSARRSSAREEAAGLAEGANNCSLKRKNKKAFFHVSSRRGKVQAKRGAKEMEENFFKSATRNEIGAAVFSMAIDKKKRSALGAPSAFSEEDRVEKNARARAR